MHSKFPLTRFSVFSYSGRKIFRYSVHSEDRDEKHP